MYIIYIFAGPAQPANAAKEELVRQLGSHFTVWSQESSGPNRPRGFQERDERGDSQWWETRRGWRGEQARSWTTQPVVVIFGSWQLLVILVHCTYAQYGTAHSQKPAQRAAWRQDLPSFEAHKQLWASTHMVSGFVPNASVPQASLLVGLPRLCGVRPMWKTRRSALKQGDSDLGSNWEIRMLLRFVNCLCGERGIFK